MLTAAAKSKKKRDDKAASLAAGGVIDPAYGSVFPATRRLVLTMRRCSGIKGGGASITRVGVGMAEPPDVV